MEKTTPKEKSLELYRKLRDEFPVLSANVRAKQCALIAVDEIINSNPCKVECHEHELNTDYWQQVKDEIKKL